MTQLFFEVDASGVERALQLVTDELDEDQVLDEAASIILNNTRQRYLQEVDPEGKPWVPSMAAIRRRQSGGTGTLFATGTLFRSIQEVNPNDGTRRIVAGAYNKHGTEYGQFAQHGTKFMPKRVFLGVADSDIELFEARVMQRVAVALGID